MIVIGSLQKKYIGHNSVAERWSVFHSFTSDYSVWHAQVFKSAQQFNMFTDLPHGSVLAVIFPCSVHEPVEFCCGGIKPEIDARQIDDDRDKTI